MLSSGIKSPEHETLRGKLNIAKSGTWKQGKESVTDSIMAQVPSVGHRQLVAVDQSTHDFGDANPLQLVRHHGWP